MIKTVIAIFLFVLMTGSAAHARGLSIIRDTQIESILKSWATPVLKEAGLSIDQVNIALVNSGEVNAFVAGGSNIFIYAGLIQTAQYPEEVIGVIAHEIGHITGGHLIASRKAIEKASFQSILATVLGVGAAVVTGNGGAASAISLGGSGLAQRGFFSHSRTQESSADQAGLKYLRHAGITAQGMVSFLEKLEGQELLPASQQSQYMRTHPLTRDRIDAVREGVKKETMSHVLGQSNKQQEFDYIKAKLLAFREPHNVPRYYNPNSGNDLDLYATAIMHYQQKRFDDALTIFDDLILRNPKNPYFLEMKAQILRDAGRLPEAEKFYRKTLKLIKQKAPLIEMSLAHVLVEQQKNPNEAEKLLINSLASGDRDIYAYRLLATIKGRQGNNGASQYYLAQEAVAQGRRAEGRRLLQAAMNSKKLTGSLIIKAQDLKTYLDGLPDKS